VRRSPQLSIYPLRGQGKTGCVITNPGRVEISERPAIIKDRIRYGYLEGDLIVGAKQSGYIMTLVCRTSRILIVRKCKKKEAQLVADTIIDSLQDIPTSWVNTLTFDNGTEFFAHQRMAHELKADIYFSQPYRSWQRGTNENINGLIRRHIPKGTSFKHLTQKQLDEIVDQINNRPRKCLGYQTPYEIFQKQRY
jgi:transposase, IS30 family